MTTDSVPAHNDLIAEGRDLSALTFHERQTYREWIAKAADALEQQSSLLATARADALNEVLSILGNLMSIEWDEVQSTETRTYMAYLKVMGLVSRARTVVPLTTEEKN